MVSRENEILFACAAVGTVLAVLVADGLDAPPAIPPSVLVFVGAILPMAINNYLEQAGNA
jgi:hypothetical protein